MRLIAYIVVTLSLMGSLTVRASSQKPRSMVRDPRTGGTRHFSPFNLPRNASNVVLTTRSGANTNNSGGIFSPKIAIQVAAVGMLWYGVPGLMSPHALHKAILGIAEPMTDSMSLYISLFSLRETLMGLIMMACARLCNDDFCKLMLFTVLFGFLPGQLWILGSKSEVFTDAGKYRFLLLSQFFFTIYLGIAGYRSL